MKYIIGVVGENGAGKDTFTTFFRAAAAPLTVSKLHFSDVLYDTLRIWNIETTRSNLQNVAIIMDGQYGKGSLTRTTASRIQAARADIIIVEGIRWKTDVPMIRSFPNSILVYVTAKPDVRFERLRAREEKAHEKKLTRKQFEGEEKAATELDIPQIGKAADAKIENNGTLEEFREKVEEFYRASIK